MLTKLLPEQISNFWDIIKYAVEQSLPPVVGEHQDKMNRILAAALSGRIDVWASYARNGDETRFEGIVLTKILYDDAVDMKNLLIYCIYGYEQIDKESWLSALNALTKYAKGKGCKLIVAYTELPYVVRIAQRLGANTRYTFLSFEVEKVIQNLDSLGGG